MDEETLTHYNRAIAVLGKRIEFSDSFDESLQMLYPTSTGCFDTVEVGLSASGRKKIMVSGALFRPAIRGWIPFTFLSVGSVLFRTTTGVII